VPVRVLFCGLLFLPETQLPNSDPKFTPPETTNMKYDASNLLAKDLNFKQKSNEHLTSFCGILLALYYLMQSTHVLCI